MKDTREKLSCMKVDEKEILESKKNESVESWLRRIDKQRGKVSKEQNQRVSIRGSRIRENARSTVIEIYRDKEEYDRLRSLLG